MKAWVLSLTLVLAGCMSAKLSLNSKFNPEEKPAYVDYVDYYFWGFKGRPSLNLQKICVDQKPYGVQRLKTFEDIFITFAALGIYAPATVRVWCGD